VKLTGKTPAIVDARGYHRQPFSVVKGYCEIVGIPFIPEA